MAGKQPRMLEDELLQGVKGTEHVEVSCISQLGTCSGWTLLVACA